MRLETVSNMSHSPEMRMKILSPDCYVFNELPVLAQAVGSTTVRMF